jgi:hypothetical protein
MVRRKYSRNITLQTQPIAKSDEQQENSKIIEEVTQNSPNKKGESDTFYPAHWIFMMIGINHINILIE